MKKVITGFILAVMASVALAIPSPKMIEDAIMTKHYTEAKGMVAEVLREKPEAARAHLLNAYLLAHVDKDAKAANAELNTAAGLDKKGDVKNSPLFGRTVAEIQAVKPAVQAPVRQAVVQTAPAYKPVVAPSSSHYDFDGFLTWCLIVLCIVYVPLLYLAFRKQPKTTINVPADDFYSSRRTQVEPEFNLHRTTSFDVPPRRYERQAPVERPVERVVERTVVQQAPVVMNSGGAMGAGMGAFGTAAAVAGGVVAGELLHDAIKHSGHHSSSAYLEEEYERRRRQQREAESTYYSQPTYTAPEPEPQVSYETERRSFSSGSDDSWGSSSSSSSFSSSSDSSSSWDSSSDSSSSSSSWD